MNGLVACNGRVQKSVMVGFLVGFSFIDERHLSLKRKNRVEFSRLCANKFSWKIYPWFRVAHLLNEV